MSVHKPQKALGTKIKLASVRKRLSSHSSRAAWATLNLTAMVDMFTILVVFLLANFSATGEILFMSKEITLPKANATSELLRSPVVSISGSMISLEGKRIIPTKDAASTEVTDLPDLTYGLQDIRKADELLHPGGQFKGQLILQCDQGIEFSVIRKVMYSAAAAGYANINYAVLRAGGPEGAAPAAVPAK